MVAETPEERVRQAIISYLHEKLNIPLGLMSIEKAHENQGAVKRTDLVIYDRTGNPWMVVECKAPHITLRQTALDQVARYNQVLKAPYILVSNGSTHFCAEIIGGKVLFLSTLPSWV